MPHTARHALRRSRSTSLLPGLLILTAGGAFGGMAVLPGPAAAAGTSRAAAPVPLTLGLDPLPASEQARAQGFADQSASERRAVRASRDRGPAPAALPVAAPPVPAPAVLAPAPPPPPPPPQFVRPGTGRLTSGYGSRWGRLHAGIDLAAGVGAPISAVAAGTVVSAASEGGYGLLVRVQHDDGTVTLYAHLSELLVTVGQRVTAGTYVGREGSSGQSTGPHLHFEVRVGGVPVDPAPWLRARGVDPAAQ